MAEPEETTGTGSGRQIDTEEELESGDFPEEEAETQEQPEPGENLTSQEQPEPGENLTSQEDDSQKTSVKDEYWKDEEDEEMEMGTQIDYSEDPGGGGETEETPGDEAPLYNIPPFELDTRDFDDHYAEIPGEFEVGEGRGQLHQQRLSEGGEINYNASFSDLDKLIKILESDKCDNPNPNSNDDRGQNNLDPDPDPDAQDASNKATDGSTIKAASDAPPNSDKDKTSRKSVGDYTGELPEDKLVVLGPDHPKMQRFQRALKEHLERQIYNTEVETRDMENEVRMRKKEREELGNQLYNLQYELQRQTDALEKFEKDLEKLIEKRLCTEKETEEIREEYNMAKRKLDEEIENEKRIMKAIKEMDMMEWCVRQAAEEFDGELKMRQLVDEKFEKIRQKTEIEKRDQDFYLDKVLTHVQRMEQANEGIQRQILAHQEEQRDLNAFISEAETEIEALHIEKQHLQRAWNETVAVVRSRDEALNAARATLKETKETVRNRESEMRALQNSITKEQESHERVTVLLKRRRMEERHLENQVDSLAKKNDDLRIQLSMLYNVKKEVEERLLKVNRMLSYKEKELSAPRRRLEHLNNEKLRLEDAILAAVQEQASLGKVATHISHKVEEVKNKARKLESEAAKVENDMSKVTIQVEKLRGELLNKEMYLDELEKKLQEEEKVLTDQALEIKEVERTIGRKTAEVARLNRRIQKLIEEQGGKETSPLERETEELERRINEEKEACADLQNQWLKQQDDLVTLTVRRDEVLRQNDLIRKECFIMERKKERLTRELEKRKREVKKVELEMSALRNDIAKANAKLYEDRKAQTQMDRDNILLQNEFVHLLKDAELEALELEEDIRALEEEKERLACALATAHEQAMNWDKKIKYAKELKDSIKKEQQSAGNALKLAIHHMKVRYSELCRAQEKLMQDLERSIDRRDRIIQEADYSLKRAHIHPKKTKLNIQRNYNKLKERNKALLKEALESEKQVKEMEKKLEDLEKNFECEHNALSKIKELVTSADTRINEAAVQKHKNLIEIILRQQKYKVLEAVKQQRYRPLTKSMEQLDTEMKKTEKKCFKLVELSDFLAQEFPELELHIKLIKASILPNIK